ncbi:hypothetical protein BDW71DRAFT_185621 [Aspergillus fruticulosus]
MNLWIRRNESLFHPCIIPVVRCAPRSYEVVLSTSKLEWTLYRLKGAYHSLSSLNSTSPLCQCIRVKSMSRGPASRVKASTPSKFLGEPPHLVTRLLHVLRCSPLEIDLEAPEIVPAPANEICLVFPSDTRKIFAPRGLGRKFQSVQADLWPGLFDIVRGAGVGVISGVCVNVLRIDVLVVRVGRRNWYMIHAKPDQQEKTRDEV